MQGEARAPERWPERPWGVEERRLSLTSASVNEKLCGQAAGWTCGFLVLFPAILWMRGLSDYLSRLPDRLPVSLVPRFRWNPVD